MPLITAPSVPLAQLPPEYALEDDRRSETSSSTAFTTGINRRDNYTASYVGFVRCQKSWQGLRQRLWLPATARASAKHDPRNGFVICPNHHHQFNFYMFFIRFIPHSDITRARYVLINLGQLQDLDEFHGKAVALDPQDALAPFPSLFLIHEMRVRGFNPLNTTIPDVPEDIEWQPWIPRENVLRTDGGQGHFDRDGVLVRADDGRTRGASGPRHPLPSVDNSVAQILRAQRLMPTWRAFVMENTVRDGTAEENTQKFIAAVGVEDSPVGQEQDELDGQDDRA
ncbi:uncharacterized protein BXZ73DRAFT_53366 [Epithele typhae]|uniref:uncharacterized protein n=1 Tax=Epithele typhae TaxID=378194 RepID=UPI002007F310|nr:uncharacterized protein BXZ73DRAFT_53366 [Epithele typhae]KAH9917371.1 hypothetical protein BXZ73DRAFT_53366 [Epithele typhae]